MKLNNLNKIIENYLIQNENKIKINSNDILKGDVFIALQGKKIHGKAYIKQAFDNGARYIITDNNFDLITDKKNILFVSNVLIFLLSIAIKKRNIFKGKVIGITGSAGKTSVKENLKFFLSNRYSVSASIKSYNNYLGVLISVLNMNLDSDFAIFEMGTNNFKEIRNLTKIILPQQIIITNIYPTHLENLKNTKNVANEKSDIFDTKFNSKVELLILPNSNNDELFLYKKAKQNKIENILTLGTNENSSFFIDQINNKNNNLSSIRIKTNKELIEIETSTRLYHQIYNIVICLIIFKYNNLDLNYFYEQTKNVPVIAGRGLERIITIDDKKIKFIDESYNANPVTMKICLNYFAKIESKKNQKKILILGDMNELGKDSIKYHQNVIYQITKYKFNNVILCGELFELALNDIKIPNNHIKYMANEKKIMQFLHKNIHNNDIILIKGSNSTKVNKLANLLIINSKE